MRLQPNDRRGRRRIILWAVPFVVIACGSSATGGQLRTRAAFDLNCPARELAMTRLDDRTVGVRGCQQQAVYVEVCNKCQSVGGMVDCDCTWVLDAASRHDAHAPPAAVAPQPPVTTTAPAASVPPPQPTAATTTF